MQNSQTYQVCNTLQSHNINHLFVSAIIDDISNQSCLPLTSLDLVTWEMGAKSV